MTESHILIQCIPARIERYVHIIVNIVREMNRDQQKFLKAQLLAAEGSSGAGRSTTSQRISALESFSYASRLFILNMATGHLKTPVSHHIALPRF